MKLIFILCIVFLLGCQRTEYPDAKEYLSSPERQEEVINYIIDDYPAMMKFLDKSMTNEKAKSMMIAHWHMMAEMMRNSSIMVEIMKSDSTLFNEVVANLVTVAEEDSSFRADLLSDMMQNRVMKDAMIKMGKNVHK